ncbi:unnamed protein product [Boreogadus saida]
MFSTVGEMGVLRSGQGKPPALGCHRHHLLVRLYCLNGGHHLRILPDGTVGGGRLEHDLYEGISEQAANGLGTRWDRRMAQRLSVPVTSSAPYSFSLFAFLRRFTKPNNADHPIYPPHPIHLGQLLSLHVPLPTPQKSRRRGSPPPLPSRQPPSLRPSPDWQPYVGFCLPPLSSYMERFLFTLSPAG